VVAGLEDVYFIVTILGAFATSIYFIWNTSRKFTTIELNVDLLQSKHSEDMTNIMEKYNADILRIQTQHLEDVKALENEIQRQIVERRDDISKQSLQQKDEMNNINKNIEKTNADVKGLLSKIEVNETNIETSQRVHVDLRNEDQRIIDFMTDWIQRVEDRIEDLRAEYLRMLTCYTGPNQNEQRKQT